MERITDVLRRRFTYLIVAIALLLLVIPAVCQDEEEAVESKPGFAVVQKKDYMFMEEFYVLDRSSFEAERKAASLQPAVIRKALSGARREWIAAEKKRVGNGRNRNNNRNNNQNNNNNNRNQNPYEYKRRGFPKLMINMTPTLRAVKIYETEAEADTKCTALSESLERQGGITGLSRTGKRPSIESRARPSQFKKTASFGKSTGGTKKGGERDKGKEKEELKESKEKAMELFQNHYARVMTEVDEMGRAGLRKPNPKYDDGSEKKEEEKKTGRKLGDKSIFSKGLTGAGGVTGK